ncbi:MAG: hypothetical protein A2W99_03545 [Bacteroidetes bacterium GWF2_33_16]|nr:MAG: hypothetical protein A2X00_11525 [Bacteroidetes bacterium GWE2_32_14]OFY08259.1 MAG: hypothetical protein A2W99_03545 [Bacteroidetes bacterium GWF2_33_16]
MKTNKNLIILLVIFIISLKSSGQEQSLGLIDNSLLIADYNYLLTTLEETHPNLYAYVPKDDFVKKTDEFRASINKPMSKSDFHKILLQTISLIKQGHTMVFGDGGYRNFLKSGGLAFPFKIDYNHGHIYIDENLSTYGEFVKGTEIIAINHITVNRIIDEFTPYLRVRPNGYIGATLSYNWGGFLWLLYGFSDQFTISYILPNENKIQTKTIEGASLEQINNKTRSGSNKDFEFNLEPARKTALLKLNTFHLDFDKYDSLLTHVFTEIQNSEIENLIIDVRENEGGNGNLVSTLVNYLTDKPYISSGGSQVKTSKATKLCYTTHPVLVNAIEQARKAEGDTPAFLKLVDCFLESDPGTITIFPEETITPKENQYRFSGQLYVLTSKDTYSAGTLFSAQIKDNNIGIIVGEETSDNPTMYACIMLFELPNTKINIQNSAQYSLRPGGFDDQRGVLPDFKVEPTYNDYINNYDRVLNYTYWLIDENITK